MKDTDTKTKICHVTTVHGRYDSRIFYKECKSLEKKGYDVTMIVSDKYEDEIKDGIKIISTRFTPKTRFHRLLLSRKKLIKKLLSVDAKIYHLHDPELFTLVRKLKKLKKIVIFDSHEDYIEAIGDKDWIPKLLKPLTKKIFQSYEKRTVKKIDAAIVCYHWTEERYKKMCSNVQMVLNYPVINNQLTSFYEKNNEYNKYNNRTISFAGLISNIWCHETILSVFGLLTNVKYILAGRIEEKYKLKLTSNVVWPKVEYLGILNKNDVHEKVYSKSTLGLALLDYISLTKGNIGNLSNTKIFEYMMFGLPVVCTDFILWKEIIDSEKCGLTVNPHDINQIKDAINFIIDNPDIAKQMGENGKNAVRKKYNWDVCESHLFEVYDLIEKKEREKYD